MPKGIPKNGINKGWFKTERREYKGLTYEDRYGTRKALEIREKLKKNHKGMLGKKHTPETIKKMADNQYRQSEEWSKKMSNAKIGIKNPMFGKFGNDHPNWLGDDVGYFALHDWIIRHYGNANVCMNRKDKFLPFKCNGISKKFEWANRSRRYERNIDDFVQLCKSCHTKADIHNLPMNELEK